MSEPRTQLEKGQPLIRPGERSFSLLETIIAVSLIAVLLIEMTGVYGNSIAFNDYGRHVMQASHLAKRVMSQIEYNSAIRKSIKDMAINEKDKPFDDEPDFTYSVSMEPLPNALDLMFKIMSGGLLGGGSEGDDKEESSDGKSGGAGAMLTQLKGLIQQAVGEEPIWVAKVDVSWTGGARRETVSLAMILTDMKKLEESVGKLLDTAPATNPGAAPGTTSSPQTGGQPGQPSGGSVNPPGGGGGGP